MPVLANPAIGAASMAAASPPDFEIRTSRSIRTDNCDVTFLQTFDPRSPADVRACKPCTRSAAAGPPD